MKIVADTSVCIGAGICESIQPDVFQVDDTGEVVLLRADVRAELAESIREAVDCCPSQALKLVED